MTHLLLIFIATTLLFTLGSSFIKKIQKASSDSRDISWNINYRINSIKKISIEIITQNFNVEKCDSLD